MSSCIAAQFMQYCFSSNAGARPPFPTISHRGVDHHGTDPAMKIHANSALSLRIFLTLSPNLSNPMPSDLPRFLLESANFQSPGSSPLSSRWLPAGRAKAWTLKPVICFERARRSRLWPDAEEVHRSALTHARKSLLDHLFRDILVKAFKFA